MLVQQRARPHQPPLRQALLEPTIANGNVAHECCSLCGPEPPAGRQIWAARGLCVVELRGDDRARPFRHEARPRRPARHLRPDSGTGGCEAPRFLFGPSPGEPWPAAATVTRRAPATVTR